VSTFHAAPPFLHVAESFRQVAERIFHDARSLSDMAMGTFDGPYRSARMQNHFSKSRNRFARLPSQHSMSLSLLVWSRRELSRSRNRCLWTRRDDSMPPSRATIGKSAVVGALLGKAELTRKPPARGIYAASTHQPEAGREC
jgi:hypothetical protein